MAGTVLSSLHELEDYLYHERELGGAVEAEQIRLKSGMELIRPVITQVSRSNQGVQMLALFTQEGRHILVHSDEIAFISEMQHKPLHDLGNCLYQQKKVEERLKYAARLMELNPSGMTRTVRKEICAILLDIGYESLFSLREHPVVRQLRNEGLQIA